MRLPYSRKRLLVVCSSELGYLLEYLALLNHGMISPNLERITNSFTRQFIPHLCNAEYLNLL
jgi:hypothetical protein